MKLIVSPQAIQELREIEEYIGKDNPQAAVKLPSGELLTEKGSQQMIEKAVFDHQNGAIRLGAQEYRTLISWLMDRYLAAKYAKQA